MAARVVVFCGWYLVLFLRANVEVARCILVPRSRLAPAVVVIGLGSRTPTEMAAFAGLVTLTPGTMALAMDADLRRLTVHGMHVPDLEAFRADLGELEDRMLGAMRSNRRERRVRDDQADRR